MLNPDIPLNSDGSINWNLFRQKECQENDRISLDQLMNIHTSEDILNGWGEWKYGKELWYEVVKNMKQDETYESTKTKWINSNQREIDELLRKAKRVRRPIKMEWKQELVRTSTKMNWKIVDSIKFFN